MQKVGVSGTMDLREKLRKKGKEKKEKEKQEKEKQQQKQKQKTSAGHAQATQKWKGSNMEVKSGVRGGKNSSPRGLDRLDQVSTQHARTAAGFDWPSVVKEDANGDPFGALLYGG
eukprot:SAG11_NODE_266_length_11468_cov_11.519222_10_plen_115_part_00